MATITRAANRYGRRRGRGIRPWLLAPKVIAVCAYLGGLGAATLLWWSSGFEALNKSDPRRLWVLDTVGRLMVMLVVPALLCAIVLGVALYLQHPGVFWRMRWFQVKLASLLVVVPTAHLFCSSRMWMLREAFAGGVLNEAAARQLGWGLLGALVGSVWVVALARLKPRLGQNWARAYPGAEGAERVSQFGSGAEN